MILTSRIRAHVGRDAQLARCSRSSLTESLPQKTRVVICGGGVVGASVAYHLAEMGWGPHTVLLEQGRCGGGTSRLLPGLVGVFKPTLTQVQLAQASVELYQRLDAQGLDTGWKQCGSLCVARSRDRMTVYRRMKAQSVVLVRAGCQAVVCRSWNIECELVSPEQARERCPLISVEDLQGGLWIPGDGVGDPSKICTALVSAARKAGVSVVENCALQQVHAPAGRVSGVDTSRGSVECQFFVNCAGLWARQVGKMSEPYVKVPIHAVEHYYLHTKSVPGLGPSTPVVRDPDGHIYFRESEGCLLAGGFEPVAKPAFEDGVMPGGPGERRLPEDWDHFHVLLEQMLVRVPSLGSAVLDWLCNWPEAFSPDCKWIVGQAPEIQNYYVGAGMKTVGLSAAGGVGKAMAQLIVDGSSPYDMYELDVSRFLGLHNNRKFLRDRVREIPERLQEWVVCAGLHYGLIYPFHEFQTGRNLRMSPIYPRLREAGAVFGQVMGYERPSWFHSPSGAGELVPYRVAYTNTFSKPPWFDCVSEEYAAVREGVALSDYSSFTKIDLWSKGREVVDCLQFLCSNDVDIPLGSVIHTGMQNPRGGYENDCSLVRIAHNHYLMIAPTIQQTRCKMWVQRHLPADGSVTMADVTSMYTAICVMGPFSRELMAGLTDTDLSPRAFPFFTYKELDVGLANGVRALNLTHTGELGYVLYIPNELALHVHTQLVEAGARFGLRHAGYYAMRALRVERFYAFWGQDLDTTTTPLECGRSWRVKFEKGVDFIGKDALLRQREAGVTRMYVQLILSDHDHEVDVWPWGGEPIYRDGQYVGATTTTGYGFTFKKQVCLGFVQRLDGRGRPGVVTAEYVNSGRYEVDVAGIRYEAKVNLHSPNLPTQYPDKERGSYKATRAERHH